MINPMQLSGRAVLVTGATGGLGKAIALRVAELGGRVVIVSRDQERLDGALGDLPGEGHHASRFDLNDTKAIGAWLKGVAAEAGPLSGLVHSAGVHQLHPLQIASPDRVDELMRINFSAAMELTRAFRQRTVRAENGSVVYLSSIMGLVGNRGVSAYSASKGALIAMARSLALELADQKIRVNCVCPGVVQTSLATRSEEPLTDEQIEAIHGQHPLGLGEPEDVANATAFLLSDASRWVTGQSLVVDGGYTAR